MKTLPIHTFRRLFLSTSPFPIIPSSSLEADPLNISQMQEKIQQLRQDLQEISLGGDKTSRERHLSRNKLLPRDRIQKLLDPGSSFLELSPLAGYELYDEPLPCGGLITGIGQVHSKLCMIVANDPTVKGGTYYPITVKKHVRAQEIAMENHLPCIYLVDSGGAHLPSQANVFPDKWHFGRIFYHQANLSKMGIPQIAVVLGSCTAGGAYVPAMADESIIVKEQGTIFLGGPPLVQAATGERVTAEELGGADLHCKTSGVTDHYALTERHALDLARNVLASCHVRQDGVLQKRESQPPLYDPLELDALAPADYRKPCPPLPIIARIVDGSAFQEFKPLFGTTLICGFAHIDGLPVGIIANNGILFSEAAIKGAHFIQLCDQRGIPLIFLQNITGFMVGTKAEREGIAKHGAKLVTAVSCTRVPKLTVVMGGSFGAGNYGMCGRAYSPRFMFMWPNAKIAVMGGEQAANVLSMIRGESKLKRGESWTETESQSFKAPIQQQFEKESSAYYASARLWDDGVIVPSQTRQVLAMALHTVSHVPLSPSHFGVFRM